MKRLHVHVAVEDLSESIKFYSALFATEPNVTKPDYAKWMLEDPRMNFAISSRGRKPGLDHLGIQVDEKGELGDVYARLKVANRPVEDQGNTTCCYSKSEKSWIVDPSGISWEAFLTHGESTVYGDGTGERANDPRIAAPAAEACGCAPKAEPASRCC
jgi:catechol-2,3-dioxygenase